MTTAETGTGRVALVTGASRGLGRSTALHLVRQGVGVVGTYKAAKDEAGSLVAEAAELGGTVTMLPLDVTDAAGFPAFADTVRGALGETFGRDDFDYLVNNAGTSLHAAFTETTPEQFDEIVAVHLRAPFFLTQVLLPLLRDGGRILNVSSGLTRITIPGSSAYAMAKAGVEALTRYQALELGERGIRVNVVAPGAIATDFSGGMVRDDPEVNAMVVQSTALGRIGVADDVGAAVALVLSDGFGWADGAKIELTGGQRL